MSFDTNEALEIVAKKPVEYLTGVKSLRQQQQMCIYSLQRIFWNSLIHEIRDLLTLHSCMFKLEEKQNTSPK